MNFRTTPWSVVRRAHPDRKETSLSKRHENLERKFKTMKAKFLNVFETEYAQAQTRGEVKPIETGASFDLIYCLDWFNSKKFPDEGRQDEILSYHSFFYCFAKRGRNQNPEVAELPKSLSDLTRLFDIETAQKQRNNWLADYHSRESSSATRRRDALYSETFMLPTSSSEEFSDDKNADMVESLIKVW
jgi:hypothetical protein